jgi:hypothetical protein
VHIYNHFYTFQVNRDIRRALSSIKQWALRHPWIEESLPP